MDIKETFDDKRELVLIRNYIEWSMRKGYKRNNINPLMQSDIICGRNNNEQLT